MPVPRMYRAQCQERCQLQFVSETENRNQWLEEWINPAGNGEVYQHSEKSKPEGYHHGIYRIKIKFPYRVFTNCGQDEIQRPPLGKNGIPFISGSSIKGLFRRVCNSEDQLFYCGSSEKPGCLRFHGAYPIGDWSGKVRLPVTRGGQKFSEICYTILDIAHPQQKKQLEIQETTNANTFISLLKPTLVFEVSNHDHYSDRKINWPEVHRLLLIALTQGIGGKTHNGYGIFGKPDYINYPQTIHLTLNGSGVSSTLLKGEIERPKNYSGDLPQGQGKLEFRPINTFKAALRGHITRLLAGVCNNQELVKNRVNELFGSSDNLGNLQIFWEQPRDTQYQTTGKNPTYSTQGTLHIYSEKNQEFMQQVVQFAYTMAGFGKTWRRVSHQKFFSSYHQNNLAIGCHWKGECTGFISINSPDDLTKFLDNLYQSCQQYLAINSPGYVRNWRESWHPQRVAVYSKVVTESQIVQLFHNDNFKYTPAIGGKNPGDKKPNFVSSVWHRMLPINGNQYLEIVTIFHGDRTPWNNQLQPFIRSIKEKELILSWGKEP